MKAQDEEFPNLQIPRILPFLADAILELNGCKTEGIFRVPGDADQVTGKYFIIPYFSLSQSLYLFFFLFFYSKKKEYQENGIIKK